MTRISTCIFIIVEWRNSFCSFGSNQSTTTVPEQSRSTAALLLKKKERDEILWLHFYQNKQTRVFFFTRHQKSSIYHQERLTQSFLSLSLSLDSRFNQHFTVVIVYALLTVLCERERAASVAATAKRTVPIDIETIRRHDRRWVGGGNGSRKKDEREGGGGGEGGSPSSTLCFIAR